MSTRASRREESGDVWHKQYLITGRAEGEVALEWIQKAPRACETVLGLCNNGRCDPRLHSSSRPLTRNVTRRRQTIVVNDPTGGGTETPMQGNATYSVAQSSRRAIKLYVSLPEVQ